MSSLSKNANMAKVENLAKSDVSFFQDQFYCQISMFISQLKEWVEILFEMLFLFNWTCNFKLTYVLTNPGMNYILMYILSNHRMNKNKIVTLEL